MQNSAQINRVFYTKLDKNKENWRRFCLDRLTMPQQAHYSLAFTQIVVANEPS